MRGTKVRILTAVGAMAMAITLLLPLTGLAQTQDNDQLPTNAQLTLDAATVLDATAKNANGEPAGVTAVPDSAVERVNDDFILELGSPDDAKISLAGLPPQLPSCGLLHGQLCGKVGSTCKCGNAWAVGFCYCTTESARGDGKARWECDFG